MATMYCALCQRPVDARRHFGIGSAFLAVFTAGFSLLALPFYSKRCSICRSAAVSPTIPKTALTSSGPQLADLERRLNLAESEIEAAHSELDRLREERDFYRQLLGDRALRRPDPPAVG